MLVKFLQGSESHISTSTTPFDEGTCYVTNEGNLYIDLNIGTKSVPNYQRVKIGSIKIDSSLSSTSTNPVQNKIINAALNNKLNTSSKVTTITSSSTDAQVPSAKAVYNKTMMKSGGTFTGVVTAQNNTKYTTKQIRNITMSTSAPSSTSGSNGDIWLVYSNE